MLYVLYWELNENMHKEELLQVAQKLTSTGICPLKDVNVVRWDVTPDGWGISIMEADKAWDVFSAINMCMSMKPGFFKMIKVSPAMPVKKVMPLEGELQGRPFLSEEHEFDLCLQI